MATYSFSSPLWRWDGDAAWHFVTVPEDVTDEVEARTAGLAGAFGSVRVEVTVGDTTWRTSLFPDHTRDAYLLPVKAAVRRAEQLTVDADVAVAITLLVGRR